MSTCDLAVLVICHEPYLKFLPRTLQSIDHQWPAAAERVIAFDGCRPGQVAAGWQVIRGEWRHPSPARNAAMAETTSPWLIFWDADNVMPEGYLAAAQQAINTAGFDVGIMYPDIQFCDGNLRPQRLWRTPQWDYWSLRAENYIDTASVWRREALDLIGGWSPRITGVFEDYALALDVTAAGWKAAKLDGPPVLMRTHGLGRTQCRTKARGDLTDIWKARSLAIVSLLAGRDEVFHRWAKFLLNAELPPRTSLYVVDNSGCRRFSEQAFDTCQRIARIRKLSHLHFASSGERYQPSTGEPYLARDRHLHVAQLYASILPRVTDELILTLEDDVEPPTDAVRRLGEEFGWASRGQIAVVGAAYAMPQDTNHVCVGLGNEEWGAAIPWRNLKTTPIDVGFVGGGCTMWANWALHDNPINFWWDKRLGWDAALCLQLRRRGFSIKLHGGVRCQHHVHGQAKSMADLWTISPPLETHATALAAPVHQNADSWVPPAQLGIRIPSYRPTFNFDSFINQRHRSFSTCALQDRVTIDVGIPGWLRQEDALKLYEMAYFAEGDILELGCYQGLSTTILAQAVRDSGVEKSIVSVDLEQTHLMSAEKQLAARGLGRYVRVVAGDGAAVCQSLVHKQQRFGFAFVDHSHRYVDVVEICQLLSGLISDGGFCLFHDFNDGRNNDPSQTDYGVAQAVQDSLSASEFDFYGIFGCTALYRKRESKNAEVGA
jgi:predicted O-methyltransferase YrrM/glycosyltransferase involved in cell wall biosynthesis